MSNNNLVCCSLVIVICNLYYEREREWEDILMVNRKTTCYVVYETNKLVIFFVYIHSIISKDEQWQEKKIDRVFWESREMNGIFQKLHVIRWWFGFLFYAYGVLVNSLELRAINISIALVSLKSNIKLYSGWKVPEDQIGTIVSVLKLINQFNNSKNQVFIVYSENL